MRALAIVLVAAALAVAVSASAAPIKPWIEANGSWATYSMSDVNDAIGQVNADPDLMAAGFKLDEINNGFGLGARFGLDLPVKLSVGVGYNRLLASTDASVFPVDVKYEHPANAFHAFVEYGLPMQGPVGLHLGVAGGMVSETGKLEVTALGETLENLKITGTGPLLEGYLSSSLWAAPQFGVSASLGYRYAKISEVKGEVGGVKGTLLNEDGSNMATDYSGVFLRLGLKFAFMK